MNPKSGLTVVEVSILLAVVLLVLAISMPAWHQNRQKKQAAVCAMNLDAIDAACKKYASDQGGFPPAISNLMPEFLDRIPVCPAGGTTAWAPKVIRPPARQATTCEYRRTFHGAPRPNTIESS